jgi:methionyl-tRNA formyltransferase
MKVAFFGLPLAACLLLEDGHEIGLAVLGPHGAPGRFRLQRRVGRERVWLKGEQGRREVLASLERMQPDLLVSWFWSSRLPMDFLRTARLGGIGVHPSLLPRHRGPDPYFAAIDQGDPKTGVTVHRIDAEYDTGAIMAQCELAIDPRWNAWQLARRLDRPSLQALREVVGRLSRGETMIECSQDETQATWAPEPTPEDCAVCWTWSTERILRRIRALSPVPGAFTEIGGQIVTITRATAAATYLRALLPGEAAVTSGVAVVRTADHAIELVAGDLDGQPLDRAGLASLVARAHEKMIP